MKKLILIIVSFALVACEKQESINQKIIEQDLSALTNKQKIVIEDNIVDCTIMDKVYGAYKGYKKCGLLNDDNLFTLKTELLENVAWGNEDISCVMLHKTKHIGYFILNQQGLARGLPNPGDNGCLEFENSVSVAYSNNKLVYFDKNMNIVRRTEYEWGFGFYKGFAVVCSSKPDKIYDESGEHFKYKNGKCGYIDFNFSEVVKTDFPIEKIPYPE